MSEEPAPYEAIDLNEEAVKQAAREDRRRFHPPGSAVKELTFDGKADPNLRVEALRAAATVLGPLWSELTKAGIAGGTSYEDLQNVDKTVLQSAAKYLTWLEGK